jgi:hypothetical protein
MSEELLSLISLGWQDYVVGRSWKVVQIRKCVLRVKYDVLLIHHEPLFILGRGNVIVVRCPRPSSLVRTTRIRFVRRRGTSCGRRSSIRGCRQRKRCIVDWHWRQVCSMARPWRISQILEQAESRSWGERIGQAGEAALHVGSSSSWCTLGTAFRGLKSHL